MGKEILRLVHDHLEKKKKDDVNGSYSQLARERHSL